MTNTKEISKCCNAVITQITKGKLKIAKGSRSFKPTGESWRECTECKKKIEGSAVKTLKDFVLESNKRWKAEGKKLGRWTCRHCKKKLQCRIPDKGDVSSKGFWDSATTCYECDGMNFVREYPSGKTESFKLG